MIRIERPGIHYYHQNLYTRMGWHWNTSDAVVAKLTDTERKFATINIKNVTDDEGSKELILFLDTKEQAEALKKAAEDILKYLDESSTSS
jgi:hypothetical protein